ncbi:MAG: recombination mediator RecR [Deltaproteobacteria bacterium]|jgi:recombination protein RecR|nr:recombination mediator RecR [Deltaproteobacteria bacterium]
MRNIPEPLKAVVDQFARLPGFGPKSALRAAMLMLKWPAAETMRFGQAIADLRSRLALCNRCGALADVDPCPVCADESRDRASLCVVAEWDSMLTMEQGAFYRGQYFILGDFPAHLNNINNSINPDLPDLDRLDKRLSEGEITELILGLGATVEAENTASYISNRMLARHPRISVTRLALGIPLGSEVKFMDSETLRQSMKHRQKL